MANLITTSTLEGFLNGLTANDCRVERDNEAGTVEAFDDDEPVLRAIQKGRNQPWIVRFIDSDRIKWTKTEN